MPFGSADQVFSVFIAIWVTLGLFSAAFFFLNKNAPLKRKVWPPFVIFTGVLFVGFAWAMGFPADIFLVLVPATAVITVLNLRAVRFCNSCGRTLMNQNPFSRPAFCSKCGASLKA